MNGFGPLLRERLRRDRRSLLIWTLSLLVLWAISIGAIRSGFSEQDLTGLVAMMCASPSIRVVRGAPVGTSIDAVMSGSVLVFALLLVCFMATTLAVRHTRGDEEAGRGELVAATVVDREAPVMATLAAGGVELLVACGAFCLGGILMGVDAGGMLLTAFGAWLLGLAFLGIGVLAGLAAPSARTASTIASCIVGAAFLLRGFGDALGQPDDALTHVESAAVSWASPIGWVQATHALADAPFEASVTPLVCFAPLLALLGLACALLARGRDLGASLAPERSGRAAAGPMLRSPLGLLWRLLRGAACSWLGVVVVFGALAGSVGGVIDETLSQNESVQRMLEVLAGRGGATGDTVELFVVAIGGMAAVVGCAAAMQAILHLRAEEERQGEAMFALPVPRIRWMLAAAAIGLGVGVAAVGLFSLLAGALLAATGEDRWQLVGGLFAADVMLVPVFAGLAALLVGLAPRIASWACWLLLFGTMFLGDFMPLFGDFWDRAANLSPFRWVANPLADSPDWMPGIWMALGGLALVALGCAAFRRRDLLR